MISWFQSEVFKEHLNTDAQIWHINTHYHLCRRLQQMFLRYPAPLSHSPMWDHLWIFLFCFFLLFVWFQAWDPRQGCTQEEGSYDVFRLLILYVLNNVCSKKININLCADFVPSRALCVYMRLCVLVCSVFLFLDQAQLQPHYLSVSLYVLIYFNSSLLAKRWVPPLCQLLCERRSLWPPLTVWIF